MMNIKQYRVFISNKTSFLKNRGETSEKYEYRNIYLIPNYIATTIATTDQIGFILNAQEIDSVAITGSIFLPFHNFISAEEGKIQRILSINGFSIPDLRAGMQFKNKISDNYIDPLLWINLNRYSSTIQSKINVKDDILSLMKTQLNSEHCRHHIFNSSRKDTSGNKITLFEQIKSTFLEAHSDLVLSAYVDNASCIGNYLAEYFYIKNSIYSYLNLTLALTLKVETHNHPSAISPYPGAATGIGGEIRDGLAIGKGGESNFGFSGFITSNLNLPNQKEPWENAFSDFKAPKSIKSGLSIMIDGPLGASDYSNEFGRPLIHGFFRTVDKFTGEQYRAAIKPLMLAGGCGKVLLDNHRKDKIPSETPIVLLGGPAMRIGLGGSSSSSNKSGKIVGEIDESSVQRSNPEMQRLCFEVIKNIQSRETKSIFAIHDLGAGGLSCAIPEILKDGGAGLTLHIEDIPCSDKSMCPKEIWCCEAQERFLLAIDPEELAIFVSICEKESCPYAVIGYTDLSDTLKILHEKKIILDEPIAGLFEKSNKDIFITDPVLQAGITNSAANTEDWNFDLSESIERVLRFPAVARKSFLITIGDRSVGGLVAKEPFVGPYQEPVSDCAISALGFSGYEGQALALGERVELSMYNPTASIRLSLVEALTNLCSVPILECKSVMLSANWMADRSNLNDLSDLSRQVDAVSNLAKFMSMCIAVGKDSLSMKISSDDGIIATSPPYGVISATCFIPNITTAQSPELVRDESTILCKIAITKNNYRLGGSALLRVWNKESYKTPDLDNQESLKNFVQLTQALHASNELLAYHDISDGGLIVALVEMAFTSRCGLEVDAGLSNVEGSNLLAVLFAEEPGVVIQIKKEYFKQAKTLAENHHLVLTKVATLKKESVVVIGNKKFDLAELWQHWNSVSKGIQKLRNGDAVADAEEKSVLQNFQKAPLHHSFTAPQKPPKLTTRPKVVVIRDEGSNGHIELARVLHEVGFEVHDIHLNDLRSKIATIQKYGLLCFPGGFTYGDVLGAGRGVVTSILGNKNLRTEFIQYFKNPNSLTLGFCNGCQILSQLSEIIPGSGGFNSFIKNASGQFESRTIMVKVVPSPSIFLSPFAHVELPIIVAHGEGKASKISIKTRIALKYLDNQYPGNPNGSDQAVAGITSDDGRVTFMMPHPERVFKPWQNTWKSKNQLFPKVAPWYTIFEELRRTVK